MDRRILSSRGNRSPFIAAIVATSSCATILFGCRDWAAFESVPHGSTESGGGSTDAGGSSNAAVSGNDDGAPSPSATPETFGTILGTPTVIAADGVGIVLITGAGNVLACGHEGCGASPTTIANEQHDLHSLALGYGFVAWTARGDNAVRRAARTPTASNTVENVHDNDGVVAIGLTATKVYFSVDGVSLGGNPHIRMCSPGVDCTCIGPQCEFDSWMDEFADERATEMKLDGADAFWLAENRVLGCPLAACDADKKNRVILASDPVLPFAIAIDSDQIFFGSPIEGGSLRAVARSTLTAPPPAPAAHAVAKNIGTPSRLALTATSIWFTDPSGTVARVPKAGGAAVVLATGLANPTGIAVGGGWVYVACSGDGRILRWKQD